ncbi:helix-turn-helix domain-containing protein [Ancylobacter sp. Lp-2]|uniref:helix-turn-helix domain-containing protein n=1 Tax=Ancylobacter sp. Lp-2 TaxID=2881339 RepID=UPI001E3C729F|nr:helix-turn-helix domain-containing protein [Ancylobacter sp. Lp-2]MCB4767662.1 helix-turn-helix domain-containing protein [Ancylobacter sp. Lp-2]
MSPLKTETVMPRGFFGERICNHLGMSGGLIAGTNQRIEFPFAVTHISCDKLTRERSTAIPTEDAFSILHQLKDLERHSCWLAGKQRYSSGFAAGTVSVIDLHNNPQCEFIGPFEALQFYVPRQLLEDFFHEHGGGGIDTLRWPRDQNDETLAALSRALTTITARQMPVSSLFIDQLGLSLLAHFAQTYGGLRVRRSHIEGGLAPWQERRAKELLTARIGSQVTIEEIARECQLTPSHFARAFRNSMGISPHRYLSELRIAEAKQLMIGTSLPLTDIALMCGFAEQSHFTRVFSRQVGASPGAWRRDVQNRTLRVSLGQQHAE